MEPVRIILAGLWTATMLTYLLGDVLRIFAGHFETGEMAGQPVAGWMWILAATAMLIPIVMLVLSLILKYPIARWACIGAAAFLILFNLAGLPYEGAYDNYLIGVSIVFNLVVIYYAWTWKIAA